MRSADNNPRMAASKITGFFDKIPKVSWGLKGPAESQLNLNGCELDLTTVGQKASTLRQKLDKFSQCLSKEGYDAKFLYVNYPLAKALFFERIRNEEDIWNHWAVSFSKYNMPLAVAMRRLNVWPRDPFDGYFSYNFFVEGALFAEARRIILDSILKRKWLKPSNDQVVWLNLPDEELARFFYHSNGKEIDQIGKVEQLRIGQLREKALQLLATIFKGYRIQFALSKEAAEKFSNEFIKVNLRNERPIENDEEEKKSPMTIDQLFKDPRWRQQDFYEAVRAQLGNRAVGNTKTHESWLKELDAKDYSEPIKTALNYWVTALKDNSMQELLSWINIYGSTRSIDLSPSPEPEGNYMGNQQYDEKIELLSKNLRASPWHQSKLNIYKEEGLERLAQLLVYIIYHELMHTFGIPHLPPRKDRDALMMDDGESYDLSLLWNSTIGELRNPKGTIVERLVKLAPYDQHPVDFLLKEESDVSQKVGMGEEKMGCDFYIKLGTKCYMDYPGGKEGEMFYDFQMEEDGTGAIGEGIIDEEDLYLARGESKPKPISDFIQEVLFEDEPAKWMWPIIGPQPWHVLSFGHAFGQGPGIFHPANLERFFPSREFAIDATHVQRVEAALATYDTRKIEVPRIMYNSDKPLTDDNPLVQKILDQLVEIVERRKKPTATLKWPNGNETVEEGWKERNRKKAIRLIQFYWQMGSERAGDMLKGINLKDEGLKVVQRFDWIQKQLEETGTKVGRLEK